jgi:hypothetical protein
MQSDSENTPTSRPFSTTGAPEMRCSSRIAMARSTGMSGDSVTRLRAM